MDNVVIDNREPHRGTWTGMLYFLTLSQCKYIHRKIIVPNDIIPFSIHGNARMIRKNYV